MFLLTLSLLGLILNLSSAIIPDSPGRLASPGAERFNVPIPGSNAWRQVDCDPSYCSDLSSDSRFEALSLAAQGEQQEAWYSWPTGGERPPPRRRGEVRLPIPLLSSKWKE